ncbi:MAG: hypothetical protein F4246_03375 [Rhodothermaceae bacterium]|nr:hypothetical protein [Rhodothermaceae bacterium]MYD56038.1 hypothetical protein [Rhodothermaceae bacterium]
MTRHRTKNMGKAAERSVVIADTPDELFYAPEGAVIKVPASVWEDVGIDIVMRMSGDGMTDKSKL